MNILLETTGNASCSTGVNFSNFSLTRGNALQQVKQSSIHLTTNNPNTAISISGNHPQYTGFVSLIYAGITHYASDTIIIPNWNPGQGANFLQPLTINFNAVTQFNAAYAVHAL